MANIKKSLKSIGAVTAGFLLIVVLSTAMDAILESAGILPKDTLLIEGSELLVVGVLAYRAAFSLLGCYLAARLAPANPVKHALALGILGAIISTLGSIAMKDLQPAWYGVALVAMSVPIGWLGGKLYERMNKKRI